MFGLIKSIGNKAISSLPVVFSSTRVKITTPYDPNLQQKLQQISSQILKSQASQQFKIYQQLQSIQGANFNRELRKIYEHEQCTTQSINAIIRFYTFLLTNCKNQLVICKLVSQPLVIQLTKIVLHIDQGEKGNVEDQFKLRERQQRQLSYEQQEKNVFVQTDLMDMGFGGEVQQQLKDNNKKDTNTQNITTNFTTPKKSTTKTPTITRLHYTTTIDWDQVNAYKVALIRSYINCINAQTINYMIIDNQLPIFINCINGYKHYLTQGVQGTCISNCILMILTKVDHNDQVCGIMFDDRHHAKKSTMVEQQMISKQQVLSKSISMEKSIKLHQFIQEVVVKIGLQLGLILEGLIKSSQQITTTVNHLISPLPKKLQAHEQFIQSNMLFCIDLINSISNYNYTTRIKLAIGEVIEQQLIQKVVRFVQNQNQNEGDKNKIKSIQKNDKNSRYRLNLVVLKVIKHILNLSITCQKQHMLIVFLNKHVNNILANVIEINQKLFDRSIQGQKKQQQDNFINVDQQNISQKTPSSQIIKNTLTYTCNFFLILLKQITSSHSKLSSRTTTNYQQSSSKVKIKKDQQLQLLKQTILQKLFVIIQQFTKYEGLKSNVCYKIVRNLLLGVFYLTLKEDKCSVGDGYGGILGLKKRGSSKKMINDGKQQGGLSPLKKILESIEQVAIDRTVSEQQHQPMITLLPNKINISPQKNKSSTQNITPSPLTLSFNYSILLLHKTFTQQFKQILKQNTNWQFIVNNYQSLMRQVPTNILSPQESQKYCHFHNNNNYQMQDQLRDHILVYEAIRNYRYMIIHETDLQQRFIRLENIYHKHFLSPGWGYEPGQIVVFNSNMEYKIVCTGMLHNNNLMKLPIQILHDAQCLLITHKLSENQFKIIANIRYKKIASFIPEGKTLIRMKLIGIQQLILQFGSMKMLQTFKQYLNENRNKTREKELKFINYYLNMYLKDTQEMIQDIYEGEIVGVEDDVEGDGEVKDDNDGTRNDVKNSVQQKDQSGINVSTQENITHHDNNTNAKQQQQQQQQAHQQQQQQKQLNQSIIQQSN